MAGARVSGDSKQDWGTPVEFLDSVKDRLCITDFLFDLAASDENTVVPHRGCYFTEADSALSASWLAVYDQDEYYAAETRWQWLNPPYKDIKPWVERCASQSRLGAQIACLVPASTGSNWWRDYVVNDAYILFLNGRLTFVGATAPYPRDLALLLYTPFIRNGSAVWDWREEM